MTAASGSLRAAQIVARSDDQSWFLRRRALFRLGSVQFDVACPLGWHIVFVEDRFDRAFGNARSAVDAFVWIDVDHFVIFVKALDGAYGQAGFILAAFAGFGNHQRHFPLL